MACAGVFLQPENLLLGSRKAPMQDSSWDLAVAVCPCRKIRKGSLTLPFSLTQLPGQVLGRGSAPATPCLAQEFPHFRFFFFKAPKAPEAITFHSVLSSAL